tara:strand:+ start:630 stop:1205 length:576 start_codon:yes stop_codon:yes gene_type:complete
MQGQSGGLTSTQIIELLNTDFEFGINFIIDNNPQAIENNISGLSLPLPQNPSNLQMREVIDTLLQDGSDETAVEKISEIIHVPYDDGATNYTGGFGEYLQSQQPPAQSNASGGLVIANIVGGILNVAGTIWNSYKQEDIMELQQEMLNEQYAFELDKIERTKVLGIPQSVFIAVIGFIMFVVLILFLSNRK